MIEPKAPVLSSVNVPPCTSSSCSLLSRACSPRSVIASARPVTLSRSASWTTGTSSPRSVATAMPRWTRFLRMILSSAQVAFRYGCSQQRLRDGVRGERQVGQVDAVPLAERLLRGLAQLHQPRDVGLHDQPGVRRAERGLPPSAGRSSCGSPSARRPLRPRRPSTALARRCAAAQRRPWPPALRRRRARRPRRCGRAGRCRCTSARSTPSSAASLRTRGVARFGSPCRSRPLPPGAAARAAAALPRAPPAPRPAAAARSPRASRRRLRRSCTAARRRATVSPSCARISMHRAGDGRRQLDVHLVGVDLDDRLVLLDLVARLLQPLLDRALGDGLADFRHRQREGHGGLL